MYVEMMLFPPHAVLGTKAHTVAVKCKFILRKSRPTRSFYWWFSEQCILCCERWKRIKYSSYIYSLFGKQKWFLDPAIYMETWELTGLCSCWPSKNKILLPVSKSSLYSVTLHALLSRGMILALIEMPPFSWLLSKAVHTPTQVTLHARRHTYFTRPHVWMCTHIHTLQWWKSMQSITCTSGCHRRV